MKKLVLFTESDQKKLINKRSNESKFGESIQLIPDSANIYEQLLNLDVDYVIFGIPEDIGVFANNEKTGTYSAWNGVLKNLLNIQNNQFTNPKKIAILGYLDFTEELGLVLNLNQKKSSDLKKARHLVTEIDHQVTQLVHDIVKAGKKPIIIGGGHNNAYGNIKGTSLALNKKINVINLDAHTDFSAEEGRHSGNGFSYAYSEGFLEKYFIFGIHENYTSQTILDQIKKEGKFIKYNTFEAIFIRKELKFKKECDRALGFVGNQPFGIEIDCDAIQDIPSRTMTPSGISANKTREYLNFFGSSKNVAYLHICEAAPSLTPKKLANRAAKLITYLITDFIRTNNH